MGLFYGVGTLGAAVEAEASLSLDRSERATRHVHGLLAITSELSKALTPEEIANVVLRHAYDALNARTGLAYFLGDDGRTMQFMGARGFPGPIEAGWRERTIPPPAVIVAATETGESFWFEDQSAVELRFSSPESAPADAVQAMVCLPLKMDERIIGAIAFSFSKPHNFDSEEREFMLTLSELCSQALERARLFAAESRARAEADEASRRLGVLAEASKCFAESNRSLTSSLDVIAQFLTDLLGDSATVALISLVSDEGTVVENVSARARDPACMELVRHFSREDPVPLGQGLRGRVAATGEAVFLPTVDAETIASAADGAIRAELPPGQMASMMIVPLRVRDRILGTVTMTRADPSRPYKQTDLAFVQELADRAALTIENARLYEAATRAVRVRDHFLAVAGQELLTPLTVLRLQLASLKREDFSAERAAAKLELATRGLERLDNLIDKFLDVSCISAGRLALKTEPVDLAQLVRDVATMFGERFDRSRCRLELHADVPVFGRWDRLRVEQVIANLFSNACKFGAGRPVEITVAQSGDMAFVQTRDHGIGIPREQQARIFERFEHAVQGEAHLRLGLWISRQLVEALGGRITVESSPGEGSTFTVFLPCSTGAPASG